MLASRSAIDGFGTVVTGPQDNPNGASEACVKAVLLIQSSAIARTGRIPLEPARPSDAVRSGPDL
ncbi:hypothetical protein GCM10008965_45390 [Methylorubrum aminovorans]|nr:hypothetical protein GCM10025880_65520 [Methylorubrum aminovorans]GMA80210.1 hypothetical protein GCM10025880_66270 [Methylorubrum aminovorans]